MAACTEPRRRDATGSSARDVVAPDPPQPVTREELEAELAYLRGQVVDPRAGIFGPNTIVWEIAREAAIFLGSGRAALLQLAHPYIGEAIADHSITASDPTQRFRATFRRIFRMVFGDLNEATEAARGVYRRHGAVRGAIRGAAGPFESGHAYDARDREAKVWVLATLWDTSLYLFHHVVRPLTRLDRERYYEESKRFARLFGVAKSLPPSYGEFEEYVADTLAGSLLTVTPRASEVGRRIMSPINPFGRVVQHDFATFTAHLLPEHVARAFGLAREGEAGRVRFERVLAIARTTVRRLPPRLRFLPGYLEAMRRLQGDTRRDRLGEMMNRLYLGR